MRPIVEITRLEENYTYGTFGILRLQKEVFCVTLEPPDRLNEPFVSSIPAQQYIMERDISRSYGETFKVQNVPNRTWIFFHPGNYIHNTEGCIILGQYFDKLRGDRAVLNSGQTFNKFMSALSGYNRALLTITEVY